MNSDELRVHFKIGSQWSVSIEIVLIKRIIRIISGWMKRCLLYWPCRSHKKCLPLMKISLCILGIVKIASFKVTCHFSMIFDILKFRDNFSGFLDVVGTLMLDVKNINNVWNMNFLLNSFINYSWKKIYRSSKSSSNLYIIIHPCGS